MGLLTPVVVIGGREVMEAAAEGTSEGERWPDGGEDTDELSGLRESLLSPMIVSAGLQVGERCEWRGGTGWQLHTDLLQSQTAPLSNSRPRTEARAGVFLGNQKRVV